ncbi:predicted protein [Histoplasma capsulatum H143]|uniref:Uncharacterized protein n=1 Tax=Ajellomyces capsulatus (strain H143) TaxID=544712 RepID=C6H7S0_AJECH|nr:predicted protein [Histoplasma capsulatum H143]
MSREVERMRRQGDASAAFDDDGCDGCDGFFDGLVQNVRGWRLVIGGLGPDLASFLGNGREWNGDRSRARHPKTRAGFAKTIMIPGNTIQSLIMPVWWTPDVEK